MRMGPMDVTEVEGHVIAGCRHACIRCGLTEEFIRDAAVTPACRCPAMLFMYEGEYEGDCELPEGHDPPHWDGLTTWRTDDDGYTDHDTIDQDPPPGAQSRTPA